MTHPDDGPSRALGARPVAPRSFSATLVGVLVGPLAGVLAGVLLVLCLPGPVAATTPTTTPTTTTASPTTSGARTASPAPAETPLRISFTSIVPGVVPKKGPLVLSGTITNTTTDEWRDVRLAPVLSSTPVTDVTQLREQLTDTSDTAFGTARESTDPDADVGVVGPRDTVQFSLTLTQSELRDSMTRDPGVHWIGVQAYGTGGEDVVGAAAGFARTLLPLLPDDTDSVQAGVIVPLRHQVLYGRNGAIVRLDTWLDDLAPGGRLANLLDLSRSVPPGRVTWLVDPAVLDAVQHLAAGNPQRTLGRPDQSEPSGPDPSDSPTGSPSADPSETPGTPASSSSGTDVLAASLDGRDATAADLAVLADTWLQAMLPALRRDSVLALPYADIDVGAIASRSPALIPRARRLARTTLEAFGVFSSPAVAPPSGRISPAVVRSTTDDTRILAADSALPRDLAGTEHPSAVTVTDVSGVDVDRVVNIYDEGASTPAAAQTGADTALGVRQRVLAEAALRSIAGDGRPLTVMLPEDWNPGRLRANFFAPLRLSWLDLAPLNRLIRTETPAVDGDRLRTAGYPPAQRLTDDQVLEVTRMIRAGATLQDIVTKSPGYSRVVTKQALTYIAYPTHTDPINAQTSALAARQTVARMLRRVSISVPRYWTMSGSTGRFRVDLHNGLDQAVSVQIAAETDSSLTVRAPQPIVIQPGRRKAVLLEIESTRQGVHRVKLALTDGDGTRLGRSAEVPMRSSQVSELLWLIMAAALAILVLGVALRLWRRWRAQHPQATETSAEQPPEGRAEGSAEPSAEPSAEGPAEEAGEQPRPTLAEESSAEAPAEAPSDAPTDVRTP